MKNTLAAFLWIVNILKRHKVPYQITGGFAAKIYGSKRKLADIDIEIPEEKFDDAYDAVYKDVKKFIIFAPKRYKKEGFDVFLMTLKYKGQLIDICGTRTDKLFDKKKGKMIRAPVDLKKFTRKEVFGKNIKVVPRKELIKYKSKLQRRVDKIDIKQIT